MKAGKLLNQVLEDMLAAVLVGGVLTAVLSFLAPEPRAEDAVVIVAAKDRGRRLDAARANTRMWSFSGAMGRYTRAETLPGLATACREDGHPRSVVLQVIDPRDTELCKRYANLRSSLRTGEKAPWTIQHVQHEVIATIVSAYAIAGEQALLDIDVALRSTVSQQRFDLSDTEVLITTEDDRRAALAYPAGSQFYDIVHGELRLSLSQARKLPEVASVGRDDMDSEHLDALLDSLGLDEIGLSRADKAAILSKVQKPSNPYE